MPSCDDYRFCLYEDLTETAGAALLFRGFGLSELDELEIELNGHRIPDEAVRRTRRSDAPPEWDHTQGLNGRSWKSIPEQGRIDFRADEELAFSTRWFTLAPAWLVSGQNRLTITLRESAGPEAVIDVDEVEVVVSPR